MIKDPEILLSYINSKLRNYYSSIDDLLEDLNIKKEEIDIILNQAGYFMMKVLININKNKLSYNI